MFTNFIQPIWNEHIKKYRTELLFGCSSCALTFLEQLQLTEIKPFSGIGFSIGIEYKSIPFELSRQPILSDDIMITTTTKDKRIHSFFDFHSFSYSGTNYLQDLFSFKGKDDFDLFIRAFDHFSFHKYAKEYRNFMIQQEISSLISKYNNTNVHLFVEHEKVWVCFHDGKRIQLGRPDDVVKKLS